MTLLAVVPAVLFSDPPCQSLGPHLMLYLLIRSLYSFPLSNQTVDGTAAPLYISYLHHISGYIRVVYWIQMEKIKSNTQPRSRQDL